MLDSLKETLGPERLTSFLRELASGVGQQLRPRLLGKSVEEKIKEVNAIMNELGYEAHVDPPSLNELPIISAQNCVYHKLAEKHPEVCQFDLALLEGLLETQEATQEECIVRGGTRCRFSFQPASLQKPS